MATRKTVSFNDKVEVRYYDKESIINNKSRLLKPMNLIFISIIMIGIYKYFS